MYEISRDEKRKHRHLCHSICNPCPVHMYLISESLNKVNLSVLLGVAVALLGCPTFDIVLQAFDASPPKYLAAAIIDIALRIEFGSGRQQ